MKRKTRRLTRTAKKAKADRLFSLKIRERDKGCQSCGSTDRLQCAHIFSRRYHSIRWYLLNALALCAKCHTFFTHHPAEWEQFCRHEYLGSPETWDQLRMLALEVWDKDLDEVLRGLE